MKEYSTLNRMRFATVILLVALPLISATGKSWYRGCYFLPDVRVPSKVSQQPLYQQSDDLTPAKCTRRCLIGGFSFAYLHNGKACFCRRYLTKKKMYDNACNQPCTKDGRFKCGGRKTANVYSIRGPYLSSALLEVKPRRVIKGQEIVVTLSVELASDASTSTGLTRFGRSSFNQARVNLKLDEGLVIRQTRRVIWIRGKKGTAQYTLITKTEGMKIIDFTIKNDISTLADRIIIEVGTRKPTDLRLWFAKPSLQGRCMPNLRKDDLPENNVVFVDEPVVFRAEVGSGFNLTFDWEICGEERSYVAYLKNPDCAFAVCHENAQHYTFRKPGTCNVNLRVHNEHGAENSTKQMIVITPEFRDLSVSAIKHEWNRLSAAFSDSPLMSALNEDIHEGVPLGRGRSGSDEDYSVGLSVDFYPFGPKPITSSSENEEEDVEPFGSHIPLEEGQFLRGSSVKFQARLFLNTVDESTQIEIDFGDGTGIEQNIGKNLRFRMDLRKRRSLAESSTANFQTDKKGQGKAREVALMTRSKRRVDYGFLENLDNQEPYAPPGSLTDGNSFGGGGFKMIDNSDRQLNISQDSNCILRVNFEHVYQEHGKYNVTVRIFDETHSLFASVTPAIKILNGTAELNIRCPEIVELRKTVILKASSILDLPESLTWKIFSRSHDGEDWLQDEVIDQSGFSFKKTFLWRGFYRVELTDGELSSTCTIQIEEPLSDLTLSSRKRYVQSGSSTEFEVQLGAGTSAELQLFSSDSLVESTFVSQGERIWSTQFRVDDATCYEIHIRGKNPVSTASSNKIEICGEHRITGLNISSLDIVKLNSRPIATVGIKSGSNISLEVELFSLFGRKLGLVRRRISQANNTKVKVKFPALGEPGKYLMVATAKNNVFASSLTCDSMDELVSEETFAVTNVIPLRHKISLSGNQLFRGKDETPRNESGVYGYTARINGRAADDAGLIYLWKLSKAVHPSSIPLKTAITRRYTSSALVAISLEACSFISTSSDGINTSFEVKDQGLDEGCSVEVGIFSLTNNATAIIEATSYETQELLTLIPEQIMETRRSYEFEFKCPLKPARTCSVSFGDESEIVKIPAELGWKVQNHSFAQPGLYEISISSSSGDEAENLQVSTVMVQEKILSLSIEGAEIISLELNPIGTWRVTAQEGSHILHRWSVILSNGSTLVDEFNREAEWGYFFPGIGRYIVRVVAFNEVSRQVEEKNIEVRHTSWFFNVQANSSILGNPSTFVVSTNASSNVVAVRFKNSSEVTEFDLNCLQPNFTTLNDDNNTINSYVVSYKYDRTGSYEATFSLLTRSHDDRIKRLYTLKTEVLHKPVPKTLDFTIVEGMAAEHDGIQYVATTGEIVIKGSTNFYAHFFTWKISKLRGDREEELISYIYSANSTSFLKYTFGHPGRYKVTAKSYLEDIESAMILEAEELISKVWLLKPFSPKVRAFVNYCKLRRRVMNDTVKYRCDSLTLTAHSSGTKVTLYFQIRYRPEAVGDDSSPTEIVEVIKAPSKQETDSTWNEGSVTYSFTKQGVFSITVVASNHLGNKSAEIPPDKPLDGSIRPFLFYAQRSVPRVSLQKEYVVPLHEKHTFELSTGNSKQVVQFKWEMGDGTTLEGRSVTHAYHEPGTKNLLVTAKNYVDTKRLKARVRVEVPIEEVKIQEMPMAYSTLSLVELRAIVRPPNSARNYVWNLGNNKTINDSYSSILRYQFADSGLYNIEVVASNGVTSAKSLPVQLEVQQPIHAVFNGEKVVGINQEVHMSVDLLYGTNVSVLWKINGKIITKDNMSTTYTFESVGIHIVSIELSNKLGEFPVEENIFVMENPCLLPEVNITNNNRKTFMVTRSKRLRLEVEVNIVCPFVAHVIYDWRVRELIFYGYNDNQGTIGDEIELNNTQTNRRILEIPPRELPYGNYTVSVNVLVNDTILYKEADVRVNVYPSSLVAKIAGGKVRTLPRSEMINIDASSSYDPDHLDGKYQIEYEWQCFVLNSPMTKCFRDDLEEISTTTAAPTSTQSNMRAAEDYLLDALTRNQIYRDFPSQIDTRSSVLNFPASWLITTANVFVFKVDISTSNQYPRYADAAAVIRLQKGFSEWVKISCRNCRDGKVPKNIPLQFDAQCATCANDIRLKYKWLMHEVDDGKASFYKNETSDCAPRDGDGWMSIIGFSSNESVYFGNQSYEDNDDQIIYEYTLTQSDFSQGVDPTNHPHTPIGDVNIEGRLDQPTSMRSGNEITHDNAKSRTSRSAPPPGEPDLGSPGNDPGYSGGENPNNNQPPRGSNMRDGYFGSQRPLRPPPSDDVEEADVGGSRFSRDDWNSEPFPTNEYGNGYDEPSFDPDSQSRIDPFRINTQYSSVPTTNHYQDLKHITLNLEPMTLSGLHHDTLILMANVLSEGKTYSVTAEISDEETGEKIGKTSYYFAVLRGPSYGDCSVLYREEGYQIHCAGWKNQQNDNKRDDVSRRETLNFDMSYSLERRGPRRQIYSGISNEKTFQLPLGDKPAFIHIALRNSDGARTNVCSFLPSGPNITNSTDIDFLQEAYDQSVPKKSILNQMVAIANQEETIALSNTILDSIPRKEFFSKIDETNSSKWTKEAKTIVFHVVVALKSLKPMKIKEVQHVIETLTRALAITRIVSVKTFFGAAQLYINCIDSLARIKRNGEDVWNDNFFTDESITEILATARLRLSESYKTCAIRVENNPSSEEINDAKKILQQEYRNYETDTKFSIKDELIKKEKLINHNLNKFFLGLVHQRDKVLGPLRAAVDGYGIVIQPYSKIIELFDDDEKRFGMTGRWKLGVVMPDNMESILSQRRNDTSYYIAVSSFPDVTLSNFVKQRVEQRHLSVSILNNDSAKIRPRRLFDPIVLSLPPRKKDELSCLNGFVSRSSVTSNAFPVVKRPNTTLHLEIELDAAIKRPFPVSIAITKKVNELIGPPRENDIVIKRIISRAYFRKFHRTDGRVIVKITLPEEDLHHNFGLFHVVLWNEQAMTSRSRHFDIEAIAYSLRIWWSDCFYWDDFFDEWRQDGVQVSELSTSSQTLCKTNHLSTFSASFIPVKAYYEDRNVRSSVAHTALRGTIPILFVVFIMLIVALNVHKRLLRSHELQTPTSVFRLDYFRARPRFSEIGKRLRWYFGPDHRPSLVPVILHDNRRSHNQVFEVTMQTCCWPGSGTTSNVNIILYGEDGKYEARELITPKTHHAREVRNENGYSENDDHTGIDDELFITGSTLKFVVTFREDLGPLWKVVIWHDNSGEWPNWKLDYLTIRDVSNGRKWHFPHYGWLALDRGKKSLSAELRPVLSAPSFRMHIGLKMNAFMCNFSSIGSLIASPGYGNLSRSQRAVHFFALFVTICGLATARYIFDWDIYSHDSDLPYLHGTNAVWGLLIGSVASILVLPAQLLFRFSKHDDRISVMIEDVTESHRGNDFNDYRYDSSLSIAKRRIEDQQHFDHAAFENFPGDEDCLYPNVEDAVSNWLELKVHSERQSFDSQTKNYNEKEIRLPVVRPTTPFSRNSLNSLDEEIVRCMMASLPKTSHSLRENSSPDENKKETELPAVHRPQPQSLNPSFEISPRLKQELNIMLQSGSLLAEQYKGIGGIYNSVGSTLAMDAPEIVPCEKLDPLPQDFLLPRGCQKLAWLYYAVICIGSCALTAYGSFTVLRTYDIFPWLECVLFSIAALLLLVEGLLLIIMAIFSWFYDNLKWAINREELWILLDRIFSSSSVSTIRDNSTDVYIDSSTYYPAVGLDCNSSQFGENSLEDARMARQLADRERSRYLRHIEPPETSPELSEKLIKKRRVEMAAGEWGTVIFLLVLGIVSAAIISNSYDEINAQSDDLKNWFFFTSAFPTKDKYLTTQMYENRNQSSNIFHNVKTKEDWMNWYSTLLTETNEEYNPTHPELQSDFLLQDPNQSIYLSSEPVRDVRYIVIGSPTIHLEYQEGSIDFKGAPEKVLALVNKTEILSRDQKIEVDLSGSTIKLHDSSSFGIYRKTKGHIKDIFKGNRSLHTIVFRFTLYNPFSNLYSNLEASARFSCAPHSYSSSEYDTVRIWARTFAFSEPGIDRTSPNAAYQTFFFCQVLLLLWATHSAFKTVVAWTRLALKKLTRFVLLPPETEKQNRRNWGRWLNICLEFCIWLLVVLVLAFSSDKRTKIEQVMPHFYLHEDKVLIEPGNAISQLIKTSGRLVTAVGLLNFFLIVKILVVARRYHNFPRVPSFAKPCCKSTVGKAVAILAIFLISAVVMAGIGYFLFPYQRPFSTYVLSLMNVVLSSISFGNFPAQSSNNFAAFRAKYAAYTAPITLLFFLTILVTFRLVLKAILIVVYRKRAKLTKDKSKKKKKADNAVSLKDFAGYLLENLRCIVLCVACVVLRRDPGLWEARGDVGFTSLGFSKIKSQTEREKKKLGYVSPNKSSNCTLQKGKVEEFEAGDNETCISKKYKLPSEVWLPEMESQLDELLTRASALADLSIKELDFEGNRKSVRNVGDDETEAQHPSIIQSSITSSTAAEDDRTDKPNTTLSDSNDGDSNKRVTAERPPSCIKADDENKTFVKIHPRLEKKLSNQKSTTHQSDKADSGISSINRISSPKPSQQMHNKVPRSPAHQRRPTAPVARKIQARWGQTERVEYVQPIPRGIRGVSIHDARRYGWVSDDDVMDRSSDVSSVSSSSFGTSETPVPPLTQHNLAQHNFRIFSRQTSAATRDVKSSGRSAEIEDEPSTSAASYQHPQETEATLTKKIWRNISSFKKSIMKSDPPQKVEAKARPLRRSRTNAINIKDIPNFPVQYDSDASSDKTGKKSSASTTRMRTIFSISKLGLGGTRIERIGTDSKSPGIYCGDQINEQNKTHYTVDESCVNDDLETFSIPGTVQSISRSSMSNVDGRSKENRKITVGLAASDNKRRYQAAHRSNKFPIRIQEEED